MPAPGTKARIEKPGLVAMTVDLYQTPLRYGAAYDELSADGVTPRPHWAHLMESLRDDRPRGIGTTLEPRRAPHPRERHHLQHLQRSARRKPAVADRHRSAPDSGRRVALHRSRHHSARPVAESACSRISTDRRPCWRRAIFLPRFSMPTPHFFGRWWACAFLRTVICICWPSILRVRPTASGGCCPIARRRLRAAAMRWRTAPSSPMFCPICFALRMSCASRLSFARSAKRSPASPQRDNPRIVLLTPGPHNETYFEHSYIARYLGFTLVEGADLTVRDRCVYLKTVDGLEQVDVILRRVDDSFCDPLELRSDSLLGVPGLVDAIVAGNVKVANALGSGVIETAAIMPFLPGLSRHLLGEKLKLPSVATWWCGQAYALDWVLNHLDSVVVKPAFPSRGMEPVFGAELPQAEKGKFAEQLRARPHEYVAQEQIALSTAPVWDNGRLNSRSVVLRTYVLNTGNGWIAIPGGLVRVAEAEGSVVSMQRGGHSKDAWVLWDGPVDTFSMLHPRNEPVELRRVSRGVPSSVADNVFWLGRYVERAENIARILRSMISRVRRADEAELGCLIRLHSCLESRHSKLPKAKDRRPTSLELEQELISVMTDAKRPDSLASTLAEVSRVGGNVRERLSADMMFLIGQLRDSIRD